MDKFPLLWMGKSVGELACERESLYTRFAARCRLPGEGLWCAWAVGERGELRLGVLEPEGAEASICRRFSGRMTQPLGPLLRGEVRPAVEDGGDWESASTPDHLFRSPWLRRSLRRVQGALTRTWTGGRELALPYDPAKPFPLAPMFCLARVRRLGEGWYVIYRLDRQEQPVLREDQR